MLKNASTKRGKKLFLIGTLFFWMGLYVYVPILSPYTKSLSNSLWLVGLVGGAYGFTQLLFRFPIGIWSDRVGRRKPFVLSAYIILALSCIGLALSPNAWFLLIFRGGTGIAASMWVGFTVLYSSYFREDQTARAMSHTTFCLGLGQAASSIGGKIADMYGWTAPFYAGIVLAFIGIIFMLKIPEYAGKSKIPPSFRSLLAVASRRRLLLIAIITSLSQFAVFATTYGFLTIHATDIGASKSQLGLLMFIINSCQTIAMLLTGTVIAPMIGYKAAVTTAYCGIACATFITPSIHNIPFLFVVQGAGALIRGLAYPILMGLAIQGIPKEEKATSMGFFQAVYAIGMFAGPAIGGFIGEAFGLRSIFICAGIVYLVAAGLAISTVPKRAEG